MERLQPEVAAQGGQQFINEVRTARPPALRGARCTITKTATKGALME